MKVLPLLYSVYIVSAMALLMVLRARSSVATVRALSISLKSIETKAFSSAGPVKALRSCLSVMERSISKVTYLL